MAHGGTSIGRQSYDLPSVSHISWLALRLCNFERENLYQYDGGESFNRYWGVRMETYLSNLTFKCCEITYGDEDK